MLPYYIKVKARDISSGKQGILSFVVKANSAILGLKEGIEHFSIKYEIGDIVEHRVVDDVKGMNDLSDVLTVLVP